MRLMSERPLPPTTQPCANLARSSTSSSAQRRTWLSMTVVGLLAAHQAQAQMGGGGRRAEGGGDRGSAQCESKSAEPVSATLVKIYAGERLQSLPVELQLSPEQLPLYERYRQAVENLMTDESRWTARAPVASANPLFSLGAQIDLASNRAAAWEAVLGATRPLYAALDKRQQAIADRRLVVSLEPSAWGMSSAKKGPSGNDKGDAPPVGDPPSR